MAHLLVLGQGRAVGRQGAEPPGRATKKMLGRSGGAPAPTTNVRTTLPQMERGTVHAQRKRCGRATCRCTRGQWHTAFYLFWRQGSRLRKTYIKAAEVEAIRAACHERQRRERQAREALRSAWEEWRALLARLREVEPRG